MNPLNSNKIGEKIDVMDENIENTGPRYDSQIKPLNRTHRIQMNNKRLY